MYSRERRAASLFEWKKKKLWKKKTCVLKYKYACVLYFNESNIVEDTKIRHNK